MDYSSWATHFAPLIKYGLTIGILFVWLPQLLIAPSHESRLDRWFSGFIAMVLFLMILVYFLVFIKLYEVISLSVLLLFLVYKRLCQRADLHGFSDVLSQIQIVLYDILDGLHRPKEVFQKVGTFPRKVGQFIQKHWVGMLWFALVFGYAGWLRFYDAFAHAAPPLSDSYVTLAWMKYINERILFHDGLYPHGFHIILSVIAKFSANNQLFALKYSGPLNGVLIVFTIWYLVFKMTASKASAYFAAVVYGCTGLFFDWDMFRQSATNSQEFAMVFVLPTLWFLLHYFEKGEKRDLWTAASGLCILGAVHSLVFAFTIWLCFFVLLSQVSFKSVGLLKKYIQVILFGLGASGLSMLPLALGYLFGKRPHGASMVFLSQVSANIPIKIDLVTYILLGGIVSFLTLGLIAYSTPPERRKWLSAAYILVGAALFRGVLPHLTQSVVLDLRSTTLALPFLGVAAGSLHWFLIRWVKAVKLREGLGMFIALSTLAAVITLIQPQPLSPIKMERDSMVQQYLNIKNQFLPTEWMIVSHEETYALVLGKGLHMFAGDFIKDIRPDYKDMRYVDNFNQRLLTSDIFIYYEKELYTTPYETMVEVYEKRRQERPLLWQWLQTYEKETANLDIYYEDENLIVYWIHNEKSQEERNEEIWNP